MKGAVWYTRQLEVSEGFDTEFMFRISNPSFRFVLFYPLYLFRTPQYFFLSFIFLNIRFQCFCVGVAGQMGKSTIQPL